MNSFAERHSAKIAGQLSCFDRVLVMEDIGFEPTRILMDRNTKFTLQFRRFWRSQGVEPKRLPFRAAQMNAFVETFIGKLKGECLNFFAIFSLQQLDHIVTAWLRNYHTERPHRGIGIGNRVLDPDFKPRKRSRSWAKKSFS